MIRAIVAAAGILLLATACSKVTYITPEAATDQARGGDATATAESPPTPRTATPRPTETARPNNDRIRPGVWVHVEGAGDCLNFRAQPSAADERVAINYCRPDGFQGYVAAGPRENDDGRWWFIAGVGWAVDDFLVFDRAEDLSQRVVPELAGLGRIAFVGPDGDLWTMNSDGSDRERVEPLVELDTDPDLHPTVSLPYWSPSGGAAIVQTGVGGGEQRRFTTVVVDQFGNTIYEFEGAAAASWSPDGRHISMLRDVVPGLGVLMGEPVVVDLSSGAATAIGPSQYYLEGPKWRPHSEQLLYQDDGGTHLVRADGSGDRMLSGVGRSPNWSPDGDRISTWVPTELCRGYVVYSLDRGEVVLCVPAPPGDERRGGRDGSAEDGQTDWSPDGRYFAYHTEWAVQDRSGVYVVDAEIGEQTLLPGWQAAHASFAADSRHAVFSTSGVGTGEFIWAGDRETGEVVLLAEGSGPAFVAPR